MNRRRAQGRGTSRRRTPATGFGGQTGDRVSRESRSTIHFYPALFFLSLSVSFFLFLNLAVQRGANQNTLDPDLPDDYPGEKRKLKANWTNWRRRGMHSIGNRNRDNRNVVAAFNVLIIISIGVNIFGYVNP